MQFSKNNRYRKFFVEKYGISEKIMRFYDFYVRGKSVWAFSGDLVDTQNVEVLGIRAVRIAKVLKPTTAFLRVVGKHATRNVATIGEFAAISFLRGDSIEFHSDEIERGYVVVRTQRDVLGCGYYTGDRIISEIPKKYRYQDTWL